MSEGKKHHRKSPGDIQEAMKGLIGGTIQSRMEAKMDDHLGYAGITTENKDCVGQEIMGDCGCYQY